MLLIMFALAHKKYIIQVHLAPKLALETPS